MANTHISYTALPGRSRPYFGVLYLVELVFTFGLLAIGERTRLYLGPDHLLVLRRRFFTETAHRFYFSDIQAITVQRTTNAVTANAVLFLLCALTLGVLGLYPFSGGMILLGDFSFGEELLLILACAGFGLGLALNILLGPACVTELITAVSREPLPCLSRWGTAQRALALLVPRIETAQGVPSPEFLNVQPVLAAYATPAGRLITQPPITHDSGRLHELLFGLYLLMSVSCMIDLTGNWMIKNAFDSLLFMIVLVLSCIALLRQRHSDIPSDIRSLTGFALGFSVLLFYFTRPFTMLHMFWNMPENFDPAILMSSMLNPDDPLYVAYVGTQLAVDLFVGLLGLLGIYRFRRLYRLAQHNAALDTPPPPASNVEEPPAAP
ncbi:MAG TPA: hypothetical protein PLI09_17970 [Candidatus Hydrogenedentes bacterium]|nr:hypothetical protein [Candidatus Hydrogenedentota bacterium]